MTTRTITPEAVAGFRAQLISNSCSIYTIGRYLGRAIALIRDRVVLAAKFDIIGDY